MKQSNWPEEQPIWTAPDWLVRALANINAWISVTMFIAAAFYFLKRMMSQGGNGVLLVALLVALIPFFLAMRIGLRAAAQPSFAGHMYFLVLLIGFGYCEVTVNRMLFHSSGGSGTWFPLIPFTALAIVASLVFGAILLITNSSNAPTDQS